MKAKLSLLSLAVCAAFGASSAFAQTGTINFVGTIQSGSCTAMVNGSGAGDGSINLNTASINSLNSPGATANDVNFTIGLHQDCVAGASGNYWAFFSAATSGTGVGGVHAASGRITTAKPNLHLRLRDGSDAIVVSANNTAAPAAAPGTGQGTAITVVNGQGGSPKTYTVEYYANAALVASDAGPVSTSVKYNIVFY